MFGSGDIIDSVSFFCEQIMQKHALAFFYCARKLNTMPSKILNLNKVLPDYNCSASILLLQKPIYALLNTFCSSFFHHNGTRNEDSGTQLDWNKSATQLQSHMQSRLKCAMFSLVIAFFSFVKPGFVVNFRKINCQCVNGAYM